MIKPLVGALSLVCLTACGVTAEPPLVRACLKMGESVGISNNQLHRCRCADGIARKQLDQPAYVAISHAAEVMLDHPTPEGGAQSAMIVDEVRRKTGLADQVIAGLDMTTVLLKAATRCR